MRAAAFFGAQDVRFIDIAEPVPGPGHVKIRNSHVGICGTDLHIYYDPAHSGVDFSRAHPMTGATLPQILGHEFAGTVAEVGPDVTEPAVGDRVAVWPVYYCGTCTACRHGLVNVCRTVGFHGVNAPGGALGAYTTVQASQCVRLPDNVDFRLGALVEPMATAWQAVRRSPVDAEASVLVIGAGPIGIGVYFALRAHGVRRVLVSEPSEPRRAAIGRLGADDVVDPTTTDLDAWVRERTGGQGLDLVFDAAGFGPALSQAIGLLAPGGHATVIAVHGSTIELAPVDLVLRQISIGGINAYTREDFAAVIDAMERGIYSTDGWIDEVGLDDLVPTIERLHAGVGVKALVNVGAGG